MLALEIRIGDGLNERQIEALLDNLILFTDPALDDEGFPTYEQYMEGEVEVFRIQLLSDCSDTLEDFIESFETWIKNQPTEYKLLN